MNAILTIGYEKATVKDFIATLKRAKVQVLIDVRDVPISRRRGFSKKALEEALNKAGIEYMHLRALGNPKPGREASRRGDMRLFKSIFRTHLRRKEAQESLKVASDMAKRALVCLLCFERDYSICHRSIVAEKMAQKRNTEPRHLEVRHRTVGVKNYGKSDNEHVYALV